MSYLSGIALPTKESLTVEFKSDRAGLSDRDILTAVVCLANTDGGELYIGVEDDGSVTGARADRDPIRLAAMIANRTRPSQSARVALLEEQGQIVARVEVPRSFQIVATSDGTVLRRRLLADGSPACVPFFPYEFDQRGGDLGRVDYSERPLLGATVEEFDPLERHRLRQMVDAYRGDRVLLDLSDEELDGALGLSAIVEGRRVPTVTGMLLLGREGALREHIAAHEVAFQVLQGTEVRVNDFYRTPLLRTYEAVLQYFDARVEEQELLIDGFRVPVPSYDRSAFREAVANAMIHRDYTRLGAIHVQWLTDGIEISNPGGFVEGVRLDNLLVVPPHARNPTLADAFKRVGLVERTGRGVDIIFRGVLRSGHHAPDYSRSGSSSVVVRLPGGKADLGFVRLMVEEQRRTGAPPSVESLLVLRTLEQEGSIDVATAARLIQRDEVVTRAVLETLESDGLIAARVSGNRRIYRLRPEVARQLGTAPQSLDRVHIGAEPQEQAILDAAGRLGRLTRREVMTLSGVSSNQAKRLLDRLVEQGRLVRRGVQRGTYYERAP